MREHMSPAQRDCMARCVKLLRNRGREESQRASGYADLSWGHGLSMGRAGAYGHAARMLAQVYLLKDHLKDPA